MQGQQLTYEAIQDLYWLTDSRNLSVPQKTIFFAIDGENHDGHDFIRELTDKGVRLFVVEKIPPLVSTDITFHEVENTLNTLQQLTQIHRERFDIPVIGITGSNGKTTIKEWLFESLKDDFVIAKSPKSYNSQLGVPLSVRGLRSGHELGIFEAGISEVGEMEKITPIIQPTLGIFSSLGTAHDEGFSSRQQKAAEKAKLFQHTQTVIYPAKYQLIKEALRGHPNAKPWQIISSDDEVTISYDNQKYVFNFPFQEAASLENAIHVAVTLLELGLSKEVVQERILRLRNIPMRLALKRGRQNCVLVDDTYNNDFAGLEVALNFLQTQAPRLPKTLILSDIPQTGLAEEELYPSIFRMCQEKGIQRFTGVGENLFNFQRAWRGEGDFFRNTEDLIQHLIQNPISDEAILVKGARTFAFEAVVRLLEAKVHGTRLEINLSALRNNLNFYRSLLKEDTRILVMVKAFAYGSGNQEVARLLENQHVDYLGVAYVDEGIALRRNGIQTPILVLNPSPESFSALVRYKLEPEIYSFNLLEEWMRFIRYEEQNLIPAVHLKLDTGMHRLGFREHEIEKLVERLKESPIQIASLLTHLAAADDPKEDDYTHEQVAKFQRMADSIESHLHYKPLRHALNSAGISRFPDYQFDMVRLGVGLYGIEAGGKYQTELESISTLKTVISQVKTLKAGDTVSYGRHGKVLKDDTKIATVSIGYADGYPRHFSNGVGMMYVRDRLVPVIGNICMDMCMLDVSEVDNVQEGDEVIVFGEHISLFDAAKAIETIPYEILTNIGGRVRRVFFES